MYNSSLTDEISSKLMDIQMGAFESENVGKSKRMKRMISECQNLVTHSKKLSKIVDESLAKLEKAKA